MALLAWVILAAGVIILLGFVPGLDPIRASWASGPDAGRLIPFWAIVLVSSFLPLLLIGLRLTTTVRLGSRSAQRLACLVLILGTLLTLAFGAATLGSGTSFVLVQGAMLILATVATLVFLAEDTRRARWWAAILLALPTVAALWSLSTGVAVVVRANALAQGAPFCIARPGDARSETSLAALRGFSFYTTLTGHKDTSRDYFHGVLIVGAGEDARYYNWSHAHMRFDPIAHPERLTESPVGMCVPRRDFWSQIPLV